MEDESLPAIQYKVILLGESSVGKTSLLQRYIDGTFTESSTATVGLDLRYKDLDKNNKKIRFNFWDTAGQERFRSLSNVYYKDADGIVLVCDITNKQSFDKFGNWMMDIKNYLDAAKIKLIIIGNKADKVDQKEIEENRIKEYAKKKNGESFITSAKTGEGVKEAFEFLMNKLANDENNPLRVPSFKVNNNKNNDKNKHNKCNC